MKNEQFDDWCARYLRFDAAVARAFGIDRDTVKALRSGKTRRGTGFPVPAHIALAAAAWTRGVRDFDGHMETVETKTQSS